MIPEIEQVADLPPRVETAFRYLEYVAYRVEPIPLEGGMFVAPAISERELLVHHRALDVIDDMMSGRLEHEAALRSAGIPN